MATVVNTTFKLKRGTAARWAEVNPVLAQGEPGFVIDENRLKIGDGQRAWNDLPYMGESNIFSAPTKEQFPASGVNWVLYKAEEEKKIYQWNSNNNQYEVLNFNELVNVDNLVQDEGTFIVLYGGSATDNIY